MILSPFLSRFYLRGVQASTPIFSVDDSHSVSHLHPMFEPRWLTWQELCLELRLKPKQVKRLVKRGAIVGLCHGNPQRLQTDWRYLDPSEKYKRALETAMMVTDLCYSVDLPSTQLLSSADFAHIAGLHPGTIRSMVARNKLRPYKIGNYSLFTPEQLRAWLLKRERKEPTSRRARCDQMIRWCLEKLNETAEPTMTMAEVREDDRLEEVLRRLLKKREPERSRAIREFWSRYDLARSVAAAIRGGQQSP
jgi:hypothetical protein